MLSNLFCQIPDNTLLTRTLTHLKCQSFLKIWKKKKIEIMKNKNDFYMLLTLNFTLLNFVKYYLRTRDHNSQDQASSHFIQIKSRLVYIVVVFYFFVSGTLSETVQNCVYTKVNRLERKRFCGEDAKINELK